MEKKDKFAIHFSSLPHLKFNHSDIRDLDNTDIWIFTL